MERRIGGRSVWIAWYGVLCWMARSPSQKVRQHLKNDHAFEKDELDKVCDGALQMKRQFLTPNHLSYILINPDAILTGMSVAYQQQPLEILGAAYDYDQIFAEIPSQVLASGMKKVMEKEVEHARNIMLLETMTNWRNIILPEESNPALWMVGCTHPYLPTNFQMIAIDEIQIWMHHLRATLPTLPEYMKCSTAAQSKECIEFTAADYDNGNYPEVLAMFLQWMLLVCQIVTVPWVDDNGTIRNETVCDIPEKWLVTDDAICLATE